MANSLTAGLVAPFLDDRERLLHAQTLDQVCPTGRHKSRSWLDRRARIAPPEHVRFAMPAEFRDDTLALKRDNCGMSASSRATLNGSRNVARKSIVSVVAIVMWVIVSIKKID